MNERRDVPGFLQLLESGALELKNKGAFTIELTPKELEQMMHQIVAQSQGEMKKKGVTAQIVQLNVQISNGKGEVSTAVKASKKVSFMNPKVDINAGFGMENVVDGSRQPTGRIRTTHLEVKPETLFMVIKPKDFLAPLVADENINTTFRTVLDTEMKTRDARVSGLKLTFTPENKLRVEIQGGRN